MWSFIVTLRIVFFSSQPIGMFNGPIVKVMDGQLDKTVAIGWLSKNTIRT
jgi:hypothetical protein